MTAPSDIEVVRACAVAMGLRELTALRQSAKKSAGQA